MTRRGFLVGVVAAALGSGTKVLTDRFLPKPLPPPPPEAASFTRVVVPMCFYSHVRRVTLTWSLDDVVQDLKRDRELKRTLTYG